MSFREKTAWVMLIVLILAGGFYVWEVLGHAYAIGAVPPPSLKLAYVYVGIVVIGAIIGMASLGAAMPDEAEMPADERERLAINKAGNWSGYILAFLAISGLVHFWVDGNGNVLFHFVVAGLLLSQLIEYVFQIWLFRRGV